MSQKLDVTKPVGQIGGPNNDTTIRGPPPGLGKYSNNPGIFSNFSGNWTSSTWLLLKNLRTQIDGSTLQTLCMQHGPVQNFYLYLEHGVALCKYSSAEEAQKAQIALNNCVLGLYYFSLFINSNIFIKIYCLFLGNTRIFCETTHDSEVKNILQHLGLNQTNLS